MGCVPIFIRPLDKIFGDIRARSPLPTGRQGILPVLQREMTAKGLQMNANSPSRTNPKREGMFTKIACFVGTENL
jgi:hypothetical protein